MWVFFKDLLLVSVGMGIGIVLMCILQVGKDADTMMNELKENIESEEQEMNFGQNLYQWFLSNAQSLVLMAIVVIGIYLGFKREFSKLIGFLIVALIAVGLVFNAGGVKDVLLELFNKIIGA